jgi:uncharacterized protein (DUF1501 family)
MQRRHLLGGLTAAGLSLGSARLWAAGPAQPCFLLVFLRGGYDAANLLVPGENTIAVEVHQANVGSSDIVFGLEMVLQGGNLSPSTPGLANNVTRALPAFPAVRGAYVD